MDGPLAGATVFACLFSSALVGVAVHARLPGRLLHQAGGGVVRISVAALAGMAAVLLLVMTLGQKASFDTTERTVQQLATEIVTLDRALREAGPAATPARDTLFRYTVNMIQSLWPDSNRLGGTSTADAAVAMRQLHADIAALAKAGPEARRAAAEAQPSLGAATTLDETVKQRVRGRFSPYLTGLALFGLMLAFAVLGLWAPQPASQTIDSRQPANPLPVALLFLGALVLGGAIFLLREYNDPFRGVITVSHEPLQNALFAISE